MLKFYIVTIKRNCKHGENCCNILQHWRFDTSQ